MADKKKDAGASEGNENEAPKVETAASMAAPPTGADANRSEQEVDPTGEAGADFKLPHPRDLITIPGEKEDGSDTIQVTGRKWVSLDQTAAEKVRAYAKSRRVMLRERPTEQKGS